jgi:hypothetical protein
MRCVYVCTRAISFAVGVLVGALLAFKSARGPARVVIAQKRSSTSARIAPLPDAGDLAASGALARALVRRASASREIIFMLSDKHHMRLALNLLLNLDELSLHHHLTIASTRAVCTAMWARAEPIGLSLGCGHSTYLHRGSSDAVDAGLDAYNIGDDHVYHLWWQRWFFLAEAVKLGYRVLSLDTDVSLRADPYPLLHGALAHHDLIAGLDNDQSIRTRKHSLQP